MLYRKSLYVVALSMAKTQRLDESSVADIHRKYGDHFYAKGDYDGAMAQFVQTIGWIQPSYVIRKVNWKNERERVYTFSDSFFFSSFWTHSGYIISLPTCKNSIP